MLRRIRLFLLKMVNWVFVMNVSARQISDELSRAPDLYVLSALVRRAKEIANAEGGDEGSESLETIIALYLYRKMLIEHIRKLIVTSTLITALLIALLYAIMTN